MWHQWFNLTFYEATRIFFVHKDKNNDIIIISILDAL